ncbi:MAG: Lrp/AsnC family transcriptional regulator [Candidatus Lokiarchaeota archaeon]|nr:Lrp/AsnC family transcriptional regulator [Candidatus Lokiarchaeota archaeon]
MKLSETEKKIVKIVEKEFRATPKLIAKKMNLSEQHVRNLMANLSRFEFLKRVARGLYERGSQKLPELETLGKKIKNVHEKITKTTS